MIDEGRIIAYLHFGMVIKLLTILKGLKACHILSEEGIKTNSILFFDAIGIACCYSRYSLCFTVYW